MEPESHLDSENFLLVAFGYALLTLGVCAYEARRTRSSGPDAVTVFIFLFVLQCCLPGIVIFGCLPFVDPLHPVDNPAFDGILSRVQLPVAFLVLGLTAWFVIFFYGFIFLLDIALQHIGARLPGTSKLVVLGSAWRLTVVLALGTLLTVVSFLLIGDTLVERYANLILLRQSSENVERNALSVYALSLTQSWAWLSVPALFVVSQTRGRGWLWYLCLACLAVLSVLGVSRRAIFIPFLLAYLSLVLFDGRWRLKWILAASLPLLVLVGFGKEILASVASRESFEYVGDRYSSVAGAVLRTASDVGLTVVESLGSISLIDVDMRFGVDHLLSFLRKIPVSWFGWDVDMPTRIVRVSTEAFSTPEDQDIPPGLFGQMWMDFGVVGPIFWAMLLAVQMSVVQRLLASTIITKQAAAAFAVIIFVIALPLNTGSYDFTFSVDIFVLLVAMLLTFEVARVRVAQVRVRPV